MTSFQLPITERAGIDAYMLIPAISIKYSATDKKYICEYFNKYNSSSFNLELNVQFLVLYKLVVLVKNINFVLFLIGVVTMPRPKKPEERNRIMTIAFKVISSEGFNKTTFSDIAASSGVTKSLVQYYFPKKEQFLHEFIKKSLSVCADMVDANPDIDKSNPFARFYAIGLTQYSLIMQNENFNKFILEAISDRNITKLVFDIFLDWTIENTDLLPADPSEREDAINVLQYGIGGAFEYLFNCLDKKIKPDLQFITSLGVYTFRYSESQLGIMNIGDIDIDMNLSKQWLNKIIPEYNSIMFGV